MSGERIPDPRAIDPQELMRQISDRERALQEERKHSERRVAEEKDRSRFDMDRLRAATSQHVKDIEAQNAALVRSIARLQADLDRLSIENTTLRIRLEQASNGRHPEPPAATPQEAPAGIPPQAIPAIGPPAFIPHPRLALGDIMPLKDAPRSPVS